MIDSEYFVNTYELNIFSGIIRASNDSAIYKIKHKFEDLLYILQTTLCKTKEELLDKVNVVKTIMKYPHDNIIKTYHYFTEQTINDGHTINIIMENTKGNLLDEILERKRKNQPYTFKEALKMMKDLIPPLAKLQSHKVSHRNLKPANILIRENLKDSDHKTHDYKLSDLSKEVNIDKYDEVDLNSLYFAYISPALYRFYTDKMKSSSDMIKSSEVPHNVFKSDVFSLGLIFLHAWSLQDIKGLNEPGDDAQMRRSLRIKAFENNLPEIFELLNKMLNEKEGERCDFLDLMSILETFDLKSSCSSAMSTVLSNSVKNIPNFVLNSNHQQQKIDEKMEKDIQLTIIPEGYGVNLKVQINENTQLKEIQKFLSGQENIIILPGSRFYCIINGKKFYLDEENRSIKECGIKDNSNLELLLEFNSTFIVDFISFKDPKKSKKITFDTSEYNHCTLKSLAHAVSPSIEKAKFFIVDNSDDEEYGTRLLNDENASVLTVLEEGRSHGELKLIEYPTYKARSVKVIIELPQIKKELNLELCTDTLMYEIYETVCEHLGLGRKRPNIEYKNTKIPEYYDCENIKIQDNDIIYIYLKGIKP